MAKLTSIRLGWWQKGMHDNMVQTIPRCLHQLNEAVFVEQPQGYEKKGTEYKVYRLKKAIYGLKQAPGAWYS